MSAQRATNRLCAHRAVDNFSTPPETPSKPSGFNSEEWRRLCGIDEDDALGHTTTRYEDRDQMSATLAKRLEVSLPTADC
jgi:hypothetical protein